MRRRNEDRQLSSYILIIFDIETIWKVVCNQLFEYFTNNKLFYNSQYGFRTAHSTAFPISELSDRVSYDIDNKKIPVVIYMGLAKTFGTLDHTILITKLWNQGNVFLFLNGLLTICPTERNSSP